MMLKSKYIFLICIGVWCLTFNTYGQKRWLGYSQTGKASYYPSEWNGTVTRSGEELNMDMLEGAHPFLPFGTLINVLNVDNGQEVVLRINDRPYSHKRILDMTRIAAQRLGFGSLKVINVKIKVLKMAVSRSRPTPVSSRIAKRTKSPPPSNEPKIATYQTAHTYTKNGQEVYPKGYGLQLASYSELERAIYLAKKITNTDIEPVYIQVGWEKEQRVFRVLVGSFPTKELSYSLREKLQAQGYTTFPKKHFSD